MNTPRWNPWNWFNDEDASKNLPAHASQRSQGGGLSTMDQLQADLDWLFGRSSTGSHLSGRNPLSGIAMNMPSSDMMLKPKLDIQGTDKEYIISVELPGVDPDSVNVELRDDTLFIRGEKKFEKQSENKGFYRVERSYGSFQRVLTLPEDADPDSIKATSKDGVMTIIIARQANKAPETKTIPVQKETGAADSTGGMRSQSGSQADSGYGQSGSSMDSESMGSSSMGSSSMNSGSMGSRSSAMDSSRAGSQGMSSQGSAGSMGGSAMDSEGMKSSFMGGNMGSDSMGAAQDQSGSMGTNTRQPGSRCGQSHANACPGRSSGSASGGSQSGQSGYETGGKNEHYRS